MLTNSTLILILVLAISLPGELWHKEDVQVHRDSRYHNQVLDPSHLVQKLTLLNHYLIMTQQIKIFFFHSKLYTFNFFKFLFSVSYRPGSSLLPHCKTCSDNTLTPDFKGNNILVGYLLHFSWSVSTSKGVPFYFIIPFCL